MGNCEESQWSLIRPSEFLSPRTAMVCRRKSCGPRIRGWIRMPMIEKLGIWRDCFKRILNNLPVWFPLKFAIRGQGQIEKCGRLAPLGLAETLLISAHSKDQVWG